MFSLTHKIGKINFNEIVVETNNMHETCRSIAKIIPNFLFHYEETSINTNIEKTITYYVFFSLCYYRSKQGCKYWWFNFLFSDY